MGSGALPALGSYNKFHHNCYRDALITCVVNTCTCLTAGLLVFSILGHMAAINSLPIASVVRWAASSGLHPHPVSRSGPGLVFLTYPELVLSLPASFFWAAIFFIMLLVPHQPLTSNKAEHLVLQILGVDSEFCNVEALVTGLVDNWPSLLRPHRKKFAVLVCVLSFCAGLPMCTQVRIFITL